MPDHVYRVELRSEGCSIAYGTREFYGRMLGAWTVPLEPIDIERGKLPPALELVFVQQLQHGENR